MGNNEAKGRRVVFFSVDNWQLNKNLPYGEEVIDFVWYMGLNWKQKQKSSISLRSAVNEIYPSKKVLEISTKSDNFDFATKLSAFNLTVDGIVIENAFQSSKQFGNNKEKVQGILNLSPVEAKRRIRMEKSALTGFEYAGKEWPLEPKSMFYDSLYLKALVQNQDLSEQLLEYDTFTDIEFNQKIAYDKVKGPFNTQARSAAIFVSLRRAGITNSEILFFVNNPLLMPQLYGSILEAEHDKFKHYQQKQQSLF
ncbi:hypothetical protein HAU32_11180 [Weissella confusa]|uniref:Uncharacterized protein n=1 Tax=Weissella fermenti TaxID=2987699 RepID=A0ABT6D584_9LACO|nr:MULTISPECIES: hypothetical protein [Weissella]MBJ7689500.1 hypothetical protein [Weissella confusa]MCW0926157.1 hypothetical protein [Weissella sp. LMG 11983]MDF9300293.1 hypothetical protein [Weissella sp. BK2]